MRDLRNVRIKRLDAGVLIKWDGMSLIGLVDIYVSTDAAALPSAENRIARVPMINGEYMWNLAEEDIRYYFWVIPDQGRPIQAARRVLPLEGAVNFRDLGGYRGYHGRQIRWGMLYRSGALHGLTERDVSFLQKIGLRTVVDYRSETERKLFPNRKIDMVESHNFPVFSDEDIAAHHYWKEVHSKKEVRQMLKRLNRKLVYNPDAQEAYANMLRICLQQEAIPMVQHCTAGKDRVGVGVAILLLLLGVNRETVLDDYLLSNENQLSLDTVQQMSKPFIMDQNREVLAALPMVQFEYLSAFFDELRLGYQTVERYTIEVLGLHKDEIEELRALYLIDLDKM